MASTATEVEYSPARLSFFAAVLVCGYLTVRVIIPPNQTPPERAWRTDSLWFARSSLFLILAASAAALLVLYHAALTLFPSSSICPAPEHLSPYLFTWGPVTAPSFLAILVGAPLRVGAFAGLGKSFTFGLARPRGGLVTTGVYARAQHPSYTGMALVAAGSLAVFARVDGGPAACWVPREGGAWEMVRGWAPTVYVVVAGLVVQQIATRVRQEEAMLKELFGKEWEEWHARTSRFVPGLF
ncbi:Isoprenylcysteine carboxyl methyltransferase [Cordyceps fumosorosea ARSEF 2679]|uniref:Protein-S-isoprenylcysteine O-methyltransferase n=1 Tax=Cordyceps fumosorosea (strain ARSEF 2679) TaxID=1081104 RepID=A0A168EJ95_CORFA|nr:Isoprenylcysteine carboxyl methyltransferase [Cordyceps fumosorosea ARSEF 2679]OAA73877.1 Isoprenylcysteine carboxyl methyltransferase [Cordyceps fumosorosea ARSEF 2679]